MCTREVGRLSSSPLPIVIFSSYVSFDDRDDAARDLVAGWVERLGCSGVKYNVANRADSLDAYAARLRRWSAQLPEGVRLICECHRGTHYRRLVAIDVLAFPFAAQGMLMTGTAFDAIGAGKAALVSDWPLLHEVLGDAAIPYGSTREELTACLDALTPERVARSAAAADSLRARYEWQDLAAQTFALLEEVAARP